MEIGWATEAVDRGIRTEGEGGSGKETEEAVREGGRERDIGGWR